MWTEPQLPKVSQSEFMAGLSYTSFPSAHIPPRSPPHGCLQSIDRSATWSLSSFLLVFHLWTGLFSGWFPSCPWRLSYDYCGLLNVEVTSHYLSSNSKKRQPGQIQGEQAWPLGFSLNFPRAVLRAICLYDSHATWKWCKHSHPSTTVISSSVDSVTLRQQWSIHSRPSMGLTE